MSKDLAFDIFGEMKATMTSFSLSYRTSALLNSLVSLRVAILGGVCLSDLGVTDGVYGGYNFQKKHTGLFR
jgi:hypothetical protein